MPTPLQVYKWQRLVLVRFTRAKTGDPEDGFPEIDDRGFSAKVPEVDGLKESDPVRGPVVGLMRDQTIKVKVIREAIDHAAPLFVTSSDSGVVKVVAPASGELPASKEATVELKGGNSIFTRLSKKPKTAAVQVRALSDKGPILHELLCYVFKPLSVIVQPHKLRIDGSSAAGSSPHVDIDAVMTQVKAIWASCGVTFVVQPVKTWSIALGTRNKMGFGDVNTIVDDAHWTADTINVYFVREIDDALGYGLSRDAIAGFGIHKPAVFLGERGAGEPRTTYWWANDFAHELGHFFTLWHPSDAANQADNRYDTWSMRFLMHNYNKTDRGAAPAAWPTFNDFGYGPGFRSALIAIKNVRTAAGAGRDGQCSTARNYIARGALY